jgi:phage I-like protein
MTTTLEKPIYLAADLYDDATLLGDGTMWSHAATLGTRIKDTPFTIDKATVENVIRVFKTGYPQKVCVDYEHASVLAPTTGQPIPAAGQVYEFRGVFSPSDFSGDLLATATRLAAKANPPRALDDPRNLGLWMRWKPTPRAYQMVQAREYTELSIVLYHDMEHNVTGEGQGPAVGSVGLVNTPFLDDMLPVAASRSRGGSRADPGEEQREMPNANMLQRAAAFFRKPLASEDAVMDEAEGEITTLRRENDTLKGFKSFSDVVSAEIGETDPAKATAKVRELKAVADTAKKEKEKETERANGTAADAILLKHEKRLTVPLKEHFKPLIMTELAAGVKPGETKTEKVIESLPTNVNLGRSSGNDKGENAPTDRDSLIAVRADAIMEENTQLKELAKTDRSTAYKQAIKLAAKEIPVVK